MPSARTRSPRINIERHITHFERHAKSIHSVSIVSSPSSSHFAYEQITLLVVRPQSEIIDTRERVRIRFLFLLLLLLRREEIPFTKSPWKRYAESNKRDAKKEACGIRWATGTHGGEREDSKMRYATMDVWVSVDVKTVLCVVRRVFLRTRVLPADIHRFVDYTSRTRRRDHIWI